MGEQAFRYTYSAKENSEILSIRNKYLPRSESKLDELKRLDETVRTAGMIESLCAGIGGTLIFGAGLCLAMQVIGSGLAATIFGVLIGLVGIVGMLAAYPVYRTVLGKTKARHVGRILELTAELIGEPTE